MLTMIGVSGSIDVIAEEDHTEFLRQAEAIAAKHRDDSADSEEKADGQAQVRSLVTKSFEARQASQRKQLKQMREQLRKAEAAIERREAIRDRIIARKVEDLLSGQPADWKATAEKSEQPFDVIGMGDTVSIYLPGAIPFNPPNQPPAPPQVNILKSGRLVSGYPFVVGSDGAISLPLVELIEIAGLTVREAELKISRAYIDGDILRPEKSRPTLTLIPKEEATFSAIDAAGAVLATREAASVSVTTGSPVFAGSSDTGSFEDTYGRLRRARDLVAKFDSFQGKIESTEQSLTEMRPSEKRDGQESPADVAQQQRRETVVRQQEQAQREFIGAAKKSIASIQFDLELEKEYLDDQIERLRTEVLASENRLSQAFTKFVSVERQMETGRATTDAFSNAKAQWEQRKLDLEKAKRELEQYAKISKRWKLLVGERLEKESQSE